MGKLQFCAKEAVKLVEHSHQSEKHGKTFAGETGPGLFLVGDSGCYLMSTGQPGLKPDTGDSPNKVVYAEGCDPDKNQDTWWDLKQATFGGDDGVEFLPVSQDDLKALKGCARIDIEFIGEQMSIKFIADKKPSLH